MLLAIDIGNTNIVAGCVDGRRILSVSRLKADALRTQSEYAVLLRQVLELDGADCSAFDGAIISSVVPELTGVIREAVRRLTGKTALVVGAGVKTGLNIRIDNPAQLGSDLAVCAVAAAASYAPPIIIACIDAATTLTVIDRSLCLRGGAIMPGAVMSLEALSRSASLLPRVGFEAPKACICSNTVDCMKSGAVFGAASAVDGMIERMEQELGERASIVATGALAETVCQHMKRSAVCDELLPIKGLALIYEKNKR